MLEDDTAPKGFEAARAAEERRSQELELEEKINRLMQAGLPWDPYRGTQEERAPVQGYSNAAIFLRARWMGRKARFNEMSMRLELNGKPVLEDSAPGLIGELERISGVGKWSAAQMLGGFQTVALESPKFHPIKDYLKSLEWDGTERIPQLIGGAVALNDQIPLFSRYLECFFISAVARVMKPGCKVDTALILQGAQGIRKSSFFRYLVPEESWFSDDMGAVDNKDAQLGAAASWIIEWAELESVRRTNSNAVKSFLTRQVDKFRAPYARSIQERPRTCVFVGTTNETEFLSDSTGNRRFMVIPITRVDTDSIAQQRNQLWAEALVKYSTGKTWWLTEQDAATQAERNMDLIYSDPWESKIQEWLTASNLDLVDSGWAVSIEKILKNCIDIPISQHGQANQQRVAKILSAAGWERKRRTAHGVRCWVYVPPTGWEP